MPSKIVERYPEGLFIYFQPDKAQHPRLQRILEKALPDHLVVVTETRPGCFYPADTGMQIKSTFYGYKLGQQYVEYCLAEAIGAKEAQNLEPHLPEFRTGYFPSEGCYPQEGGTIVPVAGAEAV